MEEFEDPAGEFGAAQTGSNSHQSTIDTLQKQVELLRGILKENGKTINGLKEEISTLRARLASRRLHNKPTWQSGLRQMLKRRETRSVKSVESEYKSLYKLFCKESNMSTCLTYIHPGLVFKFGRPISGISTLSRRNERPMGNTGSGRLLLSSHSSCGLDLTSRRSSSAGSGVADDDAQAGSFQLFEHLPLRAIRRIFELVLHKHGCLVHAISRLDPFVPPAEPLEHAPHLFHYGKRACKLAREGRDPNQELAVLLVCKRFLLLGVHAFYGLNTFAFSSLGEFSAFVENIGEARQSRIQHVEVAWVGNQYLTMPISPEGKWRSLRTLPVTLVYGASRLRTMVIHLNEQGSMYMRRRYEPLYDTNLQTLFSAGQPSYRRYRDLRKLQGLDVLQTIRGLDWIHFYSLERGEDERKPVWDWSFVEDMNNVCTLNMAESRFNRSQLGSLPSVFPELPERGAHEQQPVRDYFPTQVDGRIIRDWYIPGLYLAYDELRRGGLHRDGKDLDSDDSSGSDDSSDDGSDDGSDGDIDTDSEDETDVETDGDSNDSDNDDDDEDDGSGSDGGDLPTTRRDSAFWRHWESPAPDSDENANSSDSATVRKDDDSTDTPKAEDDIDGGRSFHFWASDGESSVVTDPQPAAGWVANWEDGADNTQHPEDELFVPQDQGALDAFEDGPGSASMLKTRYLDEDVATGEPTYSISDSEELVPNYPESPYWHEAAEPEPEPEPERNETMQSSQTVRGRFSPLSDSSILIDLTLDSGSDGNENRTTPAGFKPGTKRSSADHDGPRFKRRRHRSA